MNLVVRRSAVKMWLLAIVGVPFVLYGLDVLYEQRVIGRLLELIYPNGDAPGLETRDLAWAWVFVLGAGAMTAWALKELMFPRKVLTADDERIYIGIGQPWSRPVSIPWEFVRLIRSAMASDDGDIFPVLVMSMESTRDLPDRPWGARWLDDSTLAINAREWDMPATKVAEALQAMAPDTTYQPDYELYQRPAVPDFVEGTGEVPGWYERRQRAAAEEIGYEPIYVPPIHSEDYLKDGGPDDESAQVPEPATAAAESASAEPAPPPTPDTIWTDIESESVPEPVAREAAPTPPRQVPNHWILLDDTSADGESS